MGGWYYIKQVCTIARHSVLQAVRMKVVIILGVFLLVLVPALPFLLKSDNTYMGQIRLILTYSTYLTSFLLSVLTLFLSVATLNSEIKGQHVLLLDPKPVPRFVVLVGKWVGVMLINLALLIGMMGVTYGLVRYFGRRRPGQPAAAYENVKAQLLVARRVQQPQLPDIRKWIDNAVKQMKEKGMMPEKRTEAWVRQRLYANFSKSAWRVPKNGTQKWVVRGLPRFNGWLVIRFKFLGDKGPHDHTLLCRFVVNESGQPVSVIDRPAPDAPPGFRVKKMYSFAVPSTAIREDGSVEIRFDNYDPQGIAALFPFQGGLQVLYPAASLAQNFLRAGLVMLARLSFIAVLGIFASTFLSFPVGVLLTMSVFFVCHVRDFLFTDLIPKLYIFGSSMVPPGTPPHPVDVFIRTVLNYFFLIFPSFGRYDVVPSLSEGYLISPWQLSHAFLYLTLVRGGILAVAGWYIYRRRELAALTSTT